VWVCDAFYRVASGGRTLETDRGTIRVAFERPTVRGVERREAAIAARSHIRDQLARIGVRADPGCHVDTQATDHTSAASRRTPRASPSAGRTPTGYPARVRRARMRRRDRRTTVDDRDAEDESVVDGTLPRERLSPLAALVDELLAAVGYEMAAAIDAVDGAVSGYGGLFEPTTTRDELRRALEELSTSGVVSRSVPEPTGDAFVLYVDGGSRGNPGPAGAGAVVTDATGAHLARLGRPVGSRAGNNTAEYAALQLGLSELTARYEPRRLEVRIDSATVVRDVWHGDDPTEPGVETYSEAVTSVLADVPTHGYTHLADDDANPADALATVGADVAALGPGA
jgi:ribonuclease HI